MAVTIDSLELKITHDSADAVKGINSLVRALRRLKEVAGMGADLVEVAKAIRVIKQATSKSDVAKGTVSAMKQIKQATNDATQACDAHVRAWQHYLDVQDRIKDMTIFDGNAPSGENHYVQREVQLQGTGMTDASYWSGWKEHMDSFKTTAQLAKQAKEEARQQKAEEKAITEEANRRHKVEDQIVKDYEKQQANANKVQQKEAKQAYKDSVKKQTEDIKNANKEYAQVMSMFSKFGGLAMKLGGKVMSAITAPFKKAFEGYKRLVSMVKRMILRRMIMAALKVITDGFKTGLENLYQYSYAMNGLDSSHAYQNLDALATAAMYVKNSVGAAAMPVINMFIPVLQRLASWAAMAANAVNQLVSAFSGGDTYTRAKEYAVDYMDGVKDAAGGANKAAKDLRATLLGFDEINRLDAADKGSGSGGSGGGSAKLDYSSMFEEAKIDQAFKDFTDQIKQKIEAGDWTGVGELIGNKLNEVIANINTKNIGKSITTKISNGAKLVAGFLKSTDFKQIGSKIEEFIDGAIEGIDAKAFGEVVYGVVTGTIDLFIGFVKSASENGTAAKLGIKLKEFIKTALKKLRDYLYTEDWVAVGNALFDSFNDFVINFDAKEVGTSLWETIGTAWVSVASVSYTFIDRGVLEFVKTFFKEFADEVEGKEGVAKITAIAKFIWSHLTLEGLVATGLIRMWSDVVSPLLTGMRNSFGSSEAGGFYSGIGSKILTGLIKGLKERLEVIATSIARVAVVILNAIFGDYSAALDAGKKIVNYIKQGILDRLNTDTTLGRLASKLVNSFFNPIENAIDNMKDGLDKVLGKMKQVGNAKVTVKSTTQGSANGTYVAGYYTQMKAEGGFIDRSLGDLFIANERGAELVGTVNGRTAVASNQEITGIADAVYGTGAQEAALLRQQNDLLRQLLQKDMTAVVSTDSIVSGLARKNRRDGVSTVPVSV